MSINRLLQLIFPRKYHITPIFSKLRTCGTLQYGLHTSCHCMEDCGRKKGRDILFSVQANYRSPQSRFHGSHEFLVKTMQDTFKIHLSYKYFGVRSLTFLCIFKSHFNWPLDCCLCVSDIQSNIIQQIRL